MSCEPSDVVEARDNLAIGGLQFDVLPILDVRLGGSASRHRLRMRGIVPTIILLSERCAQHKSSSVLSLGTNVRP